MERIIFTYEDGIAIITPAENILIADCIKDIPTGSYFKIVAASKIPEDRTFRDAWEVEIDNTWELKND